MNRSGIKNGLHVVLKLLLILSLSVGFSCDFDLGGTPIGDTGDDDDECTVGGLERVSIASNGSQANGDSEDPSIFILYFSPQTSNQHIRMIPSIFLPASADTLYETSSPRFLFGSNRPPS